MSSIEKLRQMANVSGKASAIEQFRADFNLYYTTQRSHGRMNEDEMKAEKSAVGQAVKEHMHERDWLEAAAAHFRQLCIEIENDRERSVRIATEERNRKWKEHEADMKRRYGGRVPT